MDPSFSLPEQKRQRKRWRFILQIALPAALGGNASVQPNVQYVFNPMGQGKVDDALVLGLQMSITF